MMGIAIVILGLALATLWLVWGAPMQPKPREDKPPAHRPPPEIDLWLRYGATPEDIDNLVAVEVAHEAAGMPHATVYAETIAFAAATAEYPLRSEALQQVRSAHRVVAANHALMRHYLERADAMRHERASHSVLRHVTAAPRVRPPK